ncbi:MAG: response regulator [Chitinophagaceae bacterium]|nr:response regulator [Chitinophagaceae bacterium]
MHPLNLILLVDDDLDDQGLFLDALQEIDADARLIAAINGIDAIDKLKRMEKLPDLIFLDLNMPLMNGMQFLQELKRSAIWKDIPVIMYSTSSYKKDIDTALKAGAMDYIVKPFSFGELCESLRDAVNRNFASAHNP